MSREGVCWPGSLDEVMCCSWLRGELGPLPELIGFPSCSLSLSACPSTARWSLSRSFSHTLALVPQSLPPSRTYSVSLSLTHTHTHPCSCPSLSLPPSLTHSVSLSHTHTLPYFPLLVPLSLSLSVVEDRSSTGRTSLPLPIRGDKWQTVQSAPHMGMCPCMACLHKAWPVLLSIPLSLSLSLSLSLLTLSLALTRLPLPLSPSPLPLSLSLPLSLPLSLSFFLPLFFFLSLFLSLPLLLSLFSPSLLSLP